MDSTSTESSESDSDAVEEEDGSVPSPGPMADDLASEGYRRTESACKEDCDGLLWYHENMLVCDTCSSSIDLEVRRSQSYGEDQWERYRQERPTYRNSDRVRMPGGFLSGYDWVSPDDVDSIIADVDATDFYK